MISKLPESTKKNIIDEVKARFNNDIDEDLIDFIQDFQSKVTVEEGFAKKDTVRLYGLAVFNYNPKKVDSRNTMKRLLTKHNGNSKAAIKEFRELGKVISINEEIAKAHERANRYVRPKRHDGILSKDGRFTAK